MATIVVTIKIMPASPDVDIKKIEDLATQEIKKFGGDVGKVEIELVAFGLKAINLFFVMDEKSGGTDALEDQLRNLDDVESVEVTDVRRAIG